MGARVDGSAWGFAPLPAHTRSPPHSHRGWLVRSLAKPTPLLAPEGEYIAVFIPISVPPLSSRGPPLLPGFIAAVGGQGLRGGGRGGGGQGCEHTRAGGVPHACLVRPPSCPPPTVCLDHVLDGASSVAAVDFTANAADHARCERVVQAEWVAAAQGVACEWRVAREWHAHGPGSSGRAPTTCTHAHGTAAQLGRARTRSRTRAAPLAIRTTRPR